MTNFFSISNTKKLLTSELQAIDQLEERTTLSEEMSDKRASLISDLQRILSEEEILWKTRSKQRWLRESDDNTKFFHAVANGRKRINAIEVIEDDYGRDISSEERKRSYFFNKFKQLFGQEAQQHTPPGNWSSLYSSNRLLNPDLLMTPFTLDEVKTATFQLGSDKAPEPDGFSLIFYQTFWESTKGDIFDVFIDLQNNKLSTAPVDYSFLCLIPKKDGARKINDFRPINLINGIQKIISKVLATRLASVLPSIISPSQSAFLEGRLMLDSFVTVTERESI